MAVTSYESVSQPQHPVLRSSEETAMTAGSAWVAGALLACTCAPRTAPQPLPHSTAPLPRPPTAAAAERARTCVAAAQSLQRVRQLLRQAAALLALGRLWPVVVST